MTLTLVSHHLCPYVQRTAIALLEKGVPFERVIVDLSAKPAWFTAISPLGKVPLLRVASEDRPAAVLFESAVICEYIEETQPGPRLHPEDPLERAQHRGWMEFGSSILAEIWGLETTPHGDAFAAKRRALAAKFERVETALGSGPYFAGERFSLVDAVFGPIFRYFLHGPSVRCRSGLGDRAPAAHRLSAAVGTLACGPPAPGGPCVAASQARSSSRMTSGRRATIERRKRSIRLRSSGRQQTAEAAAMAP